MAGLGMGGFAFRPSFNNGGSNVDANAARSTARQARTEVMELRSEIERLLMVNEALWLFIKEQHGYSDDDLVKKVAEIDMRDGKLDGRVAPEKGEVETCPKCDRPVGRKRPTCLYCGSALVRDPFER